MIDIPAHTDMAGLPVDFGQRFLVTVDTEEEFDWTQPLQRTGYSLDTVPHLARFQQFCEGQSVSPVYLVDYPVATAPQAAEILRAPLAEGRAEIGIQLHPWVSPPHDEDVCERNSFAGNLPIELEREKLIRLHDVIAENFGQRPQIYRAGRYGIGPNTALLLKELGVSVDTSVRALFDYSSSGGGNFRDHPLHPYWVGAPGELLELPLTTVFWGPLRQLGRWLYPRLWRTPSVRGALSRTGLLERIPLTPEGVSAEEAIRGLDIAIDEGLPILVLSFHSPSLCAGYTPYVRKNADVDALYDWWRTIFAYLARRGIRPTTVADIRRATALASGRAAG